MTLRTAEPHFLDGASLSIAALEDIARRHRPVALASQSLLRLEAARAIVERAVKDGRVVYGVTTGFGNFADVSIPADKLEILQANLVRSHCAGVGEPLRVDETRALMLLRANVLACGYSGIRKETLELLIGMLNRGVHPLIPSQGSVGASGDLAPLAHLAVALIGEGECEYHGSRVGAAEALRAAGLVPVTLQAKEGLALINGTQMMTGLLALAIAEVQRLCSEADVAGALSLDALLGTDVAFDPRIHALRPHPGQLAAARNLAALLVGSSLRESHRNCGRVQDAYSLRCMPQVHGAVRDTLAHVARATAIEMNSATDNPLVFAESGELLSGGNFHGAPMALAADFLTIAVSELGAISERRTERLVNASLSGLPAFLTSEGGLRSGFMIAQVTAAALASENKVLAHPASVDSIPTSANKEDHVSMGAHAAMKCRRVVANVRRILAIETLCACQALEFHRPMRSSEALEAAHARLRSVVGAYDTDRPLGADIEAAAVLIEEGALSAAAAAVGTVLE
jgi:histidine ammonia-lyase